MAATEDANVCYGNGFLKPFIFFIDIELALDRLTWLIISDILLVRVSYLYGELIHVTGGCYYEHTKIHTKIY